jgi:UDP-arabinose 4-epimerase
MFAHALRYVILRHFNPAGANPEGELGEMHNPEPHLIPRVIAAALGSLTTLDVMGLIMTPTTARRCTLTFI